MRTQKIFLYIFLILSLFLSNKVFADNSIQTYQGEIIGNSNYRVNLGDNGDYVSLLGINIQTQGGSDKVYCGDPETDGYPVAISEGKDLDLKVNIACNTSIYFVQNASGELSSFYTINYINGTDLSGGIISDPNFSAGEMMIAILLFLILILILIYFLRSGLNSQKVVKQLQGNNTIEGKEFYDI